MTKIPIAPDKPTESGCRIKTYLRDQQTLSAVERFAELHEQGQVPHQARHYKALLPAQPPGPGQQFAFEVNLDACSGCKACVTACHNLNGLDDQETWRFVGLVQGKKSSTENAPASCRVTARPARDVDSRPLEAVTHFQQHVTSACHHCVDPACLTGCPVNAYEKDPVTGIVKHLDDQCIGCQYCTYTCPYGVPQYNPRRGIVRKCDMCASRLADGEAPACVQACPNEAIRITLVNVAEVKSRSGTALQIPSAPDPRYTAPATQYKSARKFPENARAADQDHIAPQSPEYPLALMLVLTQAAVGAFSVLAAISPALGFWSRTLALTATALALTGLGASTFHLGRPLYAFRVVVGLRHSWLSREAVVLGAFGGLAVASAFLETGAWLRGLPESRIWPLAMKLRPPLFWAAALAGAAGVYCSAMIYIKTPRPWWMSKSTLAKFFLTTLTGGLALAVAAGAAAAWRAGHETAASPLFLTGLAVGTLAKLALEASVFFRLRDKEITPLKKTAVLLQDTFHGLTVARFVIGALGGFLLPAVLGAVGLGSGFAAVMATAGAALVLAGELIERHLFFRAVVPPKMPGAF